MLATSLLALTLSWLPATLDCRGGPDTIVRYEIAWRHRANFGWVASGTWETTGTEITIPTPPIGEVIIFSWPVAIDAAGNRSDASCPP